MRTHTAVTRALAFAALIVSAACGPLHRNDANNPPAVIVFTNQSLDQADVFAVTSSSQRIRIGTVLAGQTERLVVPNDIAGRGDNVNIVARLLAQSRTPSSGPIPLRSGDRVQVTLPMDQRLLVVLPSDQ